MSSSQFSSRERWLHTASQHIKAQIMEEPVIELRAPTMRVAFEGCGHGTLNSIYASVEDAARLNNWDGVDLVVIGGDFQAIRNSYDMACMAVPMKYKKIGDFHEYYSGARVAPYLTIFVGGNHEASNYLSELYYGGWVAPNIYYLGAAGVIRCGPLRIAGMSGIWKGHDYRKPHFERLPYSEDEKRSIYHVREIDVRKLLQVRTQVDLGISHDWPRMAVYSGDATSLMAYKSYFQKDIATQKLGSIAAQQVLDRLRPQLWFSAHLHCRYTAIIKHSDLQEAANNAPRNTTSATCATMSVSQGLSTESTPQVAAEPHTSQNPSEVVTAEATAISAWQNFYEVAAKQEKEENDLHMEARAEHRRRVEAGELENVSDATYETTWKRVSVDDDGHRRHVAKSKVEAQEAVKNVDEIDLDLNSDSESSNNGAPVEESGQQPVVQEPDQIDLDLASSPEDSARTTKESNIPVPNPNAIDLDEDSKQEAGVVEPPDVELKPAVPLDISSPDQKDTSASRPYSQAQAFVEPKESAPLLPTDIPNKITNFLSLDKCEPHRRFLQLMTIPVISHPGFTMGQEFQRPFRLEYDKEWLAITRAFADELVFGDRYAPVPPHKGDAEYQKEILAAERWVEENIVKKGKMHIPRNFERTAPIYNPNVSVRTTHQPAEFANPQTAAFCDLIGIENKFQRNFEERQAQSNAIHDANQESARVAREHREQRQRNREAQENQPSQEADAPNPADFDIQLILEQQNQANNIPGWIDPQGVGHFGDEGQVDDSQYQDQFHHHHRGRGHGRGRGRGRGGFRGRRRGGRGRRGGFGGGTGGFGFVGDQTAPSDTFS